MRIYLQTNCMERKHWEQFLVLENKIMLLVHLNRHSICKHHYSCLLTRLDFENLIIYTRPLHNRSKNCQDEMVQ